MNFQAKVEAVRAAVAAMNSSKELCASDAVHLWDRGDVVLALVRLEKAAQYAWGFNRPTGW